MTGSKKKLQRGTAENGLIARIGEYRVELMGVAMVLIMLYHSTYRIPNAAVSGIYSHIRWLFSIGVDLFFLLSGFGLYHSMRRDPNPWHFYKKRLLRIFPTYFLFAAAWFVISLALRIETAASFLWKYTLISFFISGEATIWFISAIILLYLLFPLLYRTAERARVVLYLLSAVLYLGSFYCMTQLGECALERIARLFAVRVPTFFAGLLLAQSACRQEDFELPPLRSALLLLGCLILLTVNSFADLFFCRWLERVLFLPCSILLCGTVGSALHGLKKRKISWRFLSVLGQITLPVYLIHERVLLVYTTYSNYSAVAIFFMNIAAYVLAVFAAWHLNRLSGFLTKRIAKAV